MQCNGHFSNLIIMLKKFQLLVENFFVWAWILFFIWQLYLLLVVVFDGWKKIQILCRNKKKFYQVPILNIIVHKSWKSKKLETHNHNVLRLAFIINKTLSMFGGFDQKYHTYCRIFLSNPQALWLGVSVGSLYDPGPLEGYPHGPEENEVSYCWIAKRFTICTYKFVKLGGAW
jgi:hypothetical protein